MPSTDKYEIRIVKDAFKQFQEKKSLAVFAAGLLVGAAIVGIFWSVKSGQLPEALKNYAQNSAISIDAATSTLKIGFISDWEYGYKRNLKHKFTSRAPLELTKAMTFFKDTFRPDVLVGGGDYIESSSVSPERAIEQLESMNQIFSLLDVPRMYALGNHDLRSLSRDQVVAALGAGDFHSTLDIGDWRLVAFDTNYNKEDDTPRNAKQYVTGYVSAGELQWLREALDADRPVIVFSHHSPIPPPSASGSPIQNITNAAEVRSVLEEAGNVVAVVSGHNPMTYYEERNGIHYFIVDTLVNEKALGSFAAIELKYIKSAKYAEVFFRHLGENEVQYAVDREIGKTERDALPGKSEGEVIEDLESDEFY